MRPERRKTGGEKNIMKHKFESRPAAVRSLPESMARRSEADKRRSFEAQRVKRKDRIAKERALRIAAGERLRKLP